MLLAVLTALAVGLWLAALNARYRDVQYVIPFLIQTLLFVTPLIYPATQIPERFRPLYFMNPMAGVVEGFRWALIDAAPRPGPVTLLSVGVMALLLIGGLYSNEPSRTWFELVV
jgi:lipopolysaccharide transport system permease protein